MSFSFTVSPYPRPPTEIFQVERSPEGRFIVQSEDPIATPFLPQLELLINELDGLLQFLGVKTFREGSIDLETALRLACDTLKAINDDKVRIGHGKTTSYGMEISYKGMSVASCLVFYHGTDLAIRVAPSHTFSETPTITYRGERGPPK